MSQEFKSVLLKRPVNVSLLRVDLFSDINIKVTKLCRNFVIDFRMKTECFDFYIGNVDYLFRSS